MGSPRFHTLESGGLRVTEAWFPPRELLHPHVHDRAVFAVMLEGSFELRFGGRAWASPPGSVFVEPAEERHANQLEDAGAHVLVIQPDPTRQDTLRPLAPLLERIQHFPDPGIAANGWRIARELRTPDSVSQLAVEALALEMLITAARLRELGRRPTCLRRAIELVHDRFLEKLSLEMVAATAGVHPAHLARTFRTQTGLPLGAYIRRLRLEWAARRLATSDDALATVALAAGFADQSHFTRAFRRRYGVTPGRYRSALRK